MQMHLKLLKIPLPKLDTEDDIPGIPLQVTKAVNTEKRLATFVVLEPQDDDGTTNDLHGDWYDAKTVEESCMNFNRFCKKANLLHLMPTSAIEFVESYIQRADCTIDGKFIKKGTWLATIYVDQSPLGEDIWQGIKNGTFNGLSIQCLGKTEAMD